jgi:hypothetical protein
MMKAQPVYTLQDFNAIRICCHHRDCGAVTELPFDRVEAVMKKTGCCCPACGQPFTKPDVEGGADMVSHFAKGVLAVVRLGRQLRIELTASAPAENGPS